MTKHAKPSDGENLPALPDVLFKPAATVRLKAPTPFPLVFRQHSGIPQPYLKRKDAGTGRRDSHPAYPLRENGHMTNTTALNESDRRVTGEPYRTRKDRSFFRKVS